MDAVAHKETTDMIRRFGVTDVAALDIFRPLNSEPVKTGAIPDAVKRQAMDAVAHKETTAQIRLVKDGGHICPPSTPSLESQKMADKISRMHQTGHPAIHQEATKDNFGREYGT